MGRKGVSLCIWGSSLCKKARTALAQKEGIGANKIKAGLISPSRNSLKSNLPSPPKDMTLIFRATATQISQAGCLERHLPAFAGGLLASAVATYSDTRLGSGLRGERHGPSHCPEWDRTRKFPVLVEPDMSGPGCPRPSPSGRSQGQAMARSSPGPQGAHQGANVSSKKDTGNWWKGQGAERTGGSPS